MLISWVAVFIIALFVMVKGADWFLESAERIGLAFGLSPFIVGVTIVGIGTSFPEVVSSMFAVFAGATEIVPANAIGSNIANILLVVGASAIIGRRLSVTKSLIDLDLPLLAASTILLLGMVSDGKITIYESVLLLAAYGVYLAYTLFHDAKGDTLPDEETLPSRAERRHHVTQKPKKLKKKKRPKVAGKDLFFLVVGAAGLILGAKYLIDSVVNISEIIQIGAGVISLAAVSVGTSLPELLVSIKAAWANKSEVALGNIFGSNIFNLLAVIGIPGLFATLHLDEQTMFLGVPVLIAATFLFIISGISRRIHMWEGGMYVIFYVFFIGKLFGLI